MNIKILSSSRKVHGDFFSGDVEKTFFIMIALNLSRKINSSY